MEICERAVELEIQMRSHRNIFEFTTDVLRIPCARVIAASPRCGSRRVCANFEAGIDPPPFHSLIFYFFPKCIISIGYGPRKKSRAAQPANDDENLSEKQHARFLEMKNRGTDFRQVTNVAERSRTGEKSEERKRRGTRAVRVESASENACRIGARERFACQINVVRSRV